MKKPSQIGYSPLVLVAILLYRGFRFYRKRNLKLSHASLFGIIFFLVLIAAVAVYDSHVLATPPIPNFYSLHSWIGGLAVTVFVFQVSNFEYTQFFIESKFTIINYIPVDWRVCHILVPAIESCSARGDNAVSHFLRHDRVHFGDRSCVAWIIGKSWIVCLHNIQFHLQRFVQYLFLSLFLSDTCSRKLFALSQEGLIVNMLGVLITVFAILVIYLASRRNYKRQPLPEDAILLTGHDE